MHKCIHCDKETKNKKFCSRRCSTTYNNLHKLIGKAKNGITLKECKTEGCCNSAVRWRRYCVKCEELREPIYARNPTRIELSEKYCKDNHRSSAFSYIRYHAREVVAKDLPKVCSKCGYDKHVELAHIKSIAAFNNNDRIEDINHRDNLMFLCPNCHWEFDNGLLDWHTRQDSNLH